MNGSKSLMRTRTETARHPFLSCLVSPSELRLPSGNSVSVPTCRYRLKLWRGKPIADTYGRKPVLDFHGKAVFAEIAIVRILQMAGWDGVWVDTYSRGKFRQSMPPHECALPSHAQDLYDRICLANGKRIGGCFDVFAWKGPKYLFVESKWHDSIGKKQIEWFEVALNSGVPLRSFLIFQWSIDENEKG